MTSEVNYVIDLSELEPPIPSEELSRLYNAAHGSVYCEIFSCDVDIRTNQIICNTCYFLYDETSENFHGISTHRVTTVTSR